MDPADLKDLYDRKTRAMLKRPSFARGSGHARVRAGAPMSCEVDFGDRTMHVDLPAEEGGTASAADPGQLMSASLGACLALGYKIWAARLEVPIGAVEVHVTCEYDTRGQMGVDPAVAIGWQRIRIDVAITSAAPAADVRRMVETADRLSPMLANIATSVERLHHLMVTAPTSPAVKP
jgi:uncharacterized OsmC-like protein